MASDAKLKFLRDHMNLLNEAFKELSETKDQELDLVYAKIKEIEDTMSRQGFK